MLGVGPGVEDGAPTTRLTTTSRSVGVAYVVRPVLAPLVIDVLLFLEVLEVRVEPRVARVPETPELYGPLGDLLERRSDAASVCIPELGSPHQRDRSALMCGHTTLCLSTSFLNRPRL